MYLSQYITTYLFKKKKWVCSETIWIAAHVFPLTLNNSSLRSSILIMCSSLSFPWPLFSVIRCPFRHLVCSMDHGQPTCAKRTAFLVGFESRSISKVAHDKFSKTDNGTIFALPIGSQISTFSRLASVESTLYSLKLSSPAAYTFYLLFQILLCQCSL
jgi:hypothetical protein